MEYCTIQDVQESFKACVFHQIVFITSILSNIFWGTHFIYYITTNYYSIKENPAKTKTNRKTVNAMLQKSQTKTSSYVCTIIKKSPLTIARYM